LQQGPPWQHVFGTGAAPDVANIEYAASRTPSSSATANLVTFKAMPFPGSSLISEPYPISHITAPKQMFIFAKTAAVVSCATSADVDGGRFPAVFFIDLNGHFKILCFDSAFGPSAGPHLNGFSFF